MDFIELTETEKKELIGMFEQHEIDSLSMAESILQKIAGIYIKKGSYPEMADLYREVASTLSGLTENKK